MEKQKSKHSPLLSTVVPLINMKRFYTCEKFAISNTCVLKSLGNAGLDNDVVRVMFPKIAANVRKLYRTKQWSR